MTRIPPTDPRPMPLWLATLWIAPATAFFLAVCAGWVHL